MTVKSARRNARGRADKRRKAEVGPTAEDKSLITTPGGAATESPTIPAKVEPHRG